MNKEIIKKKIIEKLFAKFSILSDEREKEEFEKELQKDFENLEKTYYKSTLTNLKNFSTL